MTRCAVLGSPIVHSLSPVLHQAAYDALRLDWTYDAIEVDSPGLEEFIDGLGPAWRGLSLTMPLKRTVIPLLTSSDEWVEVSGVANTVVLSDDGARHGANTDIPGAVAAIRERTDAEFRNAVVLGGGATAASVLLSLRSMGLESASLMVRDPARAAETVSVLGDLPVDVGTLDGPVPVADIVVSTIPATAQAPTLVDALADVPVVFEVLYDPWPTPLAAAAADRVLVTGLDLLVHQAGLQVELMTGADEAPLDAMRAAGEAALAARA